ncbi:ABC transporter substrate-binding protein [Halobacterium sp. KA-6]|jgi:glucose/mannose transport system substrate-binding protein|uniref:ABC transporter substrate-binding protein n=1 Tax=Halobacterium sp. KA-6 TaxID=2896368 RepID=UPI001E2F4F43|nr:extracellular solute-binding protein [Halobacterium sp. KA-6]MCD2204350.1 extracellular solute-binding protein [Halobacterium sp. KA-6]
MTSNNNLTRRRYLQGAGATGAVLTMAGCLGGGGDGDSGGDGTTEAGGTTTSSGSQELEIVHWWTAGGEADALEALVEGFEEEYPEVTVTNNAAPGGAGSALDTEIQSRILNNNPPSTFQIWPGKALNTYTESEVLEDIGDSVWDQEMRDAYLDGVKQMSQPAGNYVAVPLNIHRLNNLFYNVEVVESAGVDPSSLSTPADVLSAMETIDAETDATPMAHQTQAPWSTLQLWESVLIGAAGVDTYNDILAGNVAANEDVVRESLQLVADYSEYFNEDAGSVAWDQANNGVIQGNAAFLHQGDWAAGQYQAAEDFEYESDWDYVPFPGTDSVYHVVTDSFVMPTSNPSPEATEKWLSYCGSVDGQERFNPIKGSIPPRTDVPNDEFGPFLTTQREDFNNSDAQPPSIAHGTGVTPEVKSNIEGVFSSFNGSWNVDNAYNGLTNAF